MICAACNKELEIAKDLSKEEKHTYLLSINNCGRSIRTVTAIVVGGMSVGTYESGTLNQ